MADRHALNRAFAEYARTIARPYAIGDVLYRLTDQSVELLAVDGARVSLADEDGHLQFVTATDAVVTEVEHRHIESAEGPCHDAFRTSQCVLVADLKEDDRWPQYAPATVAAGIRAAAGIPMAVDGQRIGALNLYCRGPHHWDDAEIEIAQLLAEMATGYILNARRAQASEELSSQLQHALDSRVVIEQAKGILAERHRVDPGKAFERIRAHARSTRVKLHDVARAVVEGELRL